MSVDEGEAVLVWGAGAIGSTIGAHLVNAGRRVVFVDVNEAHLDEIRAGRLHIDGPVADFVVGAPAFLPGELSGNFNLILLAVRLHHTQKATAELLRHLTPDGVVISCQNGFGALDVAKVAGPERTVAASLFLPATFNGPGHVTYGARSSLTIGCVNGASGPDMQAGLTVLRDFAPDTHVADDILSVIWTKMAYGLLLAAAALEDGLTVKFLGDAELRPIVQALMREVVAVAAASGHPAQDADWFQPNAFVGRHPERQDACIAAVLARLQNSAKQHSGYWQQIVQLNRKTELLVQFAPMRLLAREHGVPIPVTSRLLDLIEQLEAGRRLAGRETMGELLKVARADAL